MITRGRKCDFVSRRRPTHVSVDMSLYIDVALLVSTQLCFHFRVPGTGCSAVPVVVQHMLWYSEFRPIHVWAISCVSFVQDIPFEFSTGMVDPAADREVTIDIWERVNS